MKNVIVTNARPFISDSSSGTTATSRMECLQDLPEVEAKKGYWISTWSRLGTDGVEFRFEEGLHMVFNAEGEANQVCDYLRTNAEIDNEVVKIGNPSSP